MSAPEAGSEQQILIDGRHLRVLVLADYFLPGFKGGGPIVSISRLLDRLSDQVDFFVLTRDRDLGDPEPYPGIETGTWVRTPTASVFYAPSKGLGAKGVLEAIRTVRPDIVYLNSYFSLSTRSTMFLKRLGLLRGIGVIIAPRGEFSPGALALKRAKKMAFIRFANSVGLYSGCLWQVSADRELRECQDVVHEREHFFVRAPDLLDPESVRSCEAARQPKTAGSARFVFLSRISPKKNLLGAIEALAEVRGEATLTVYGPEEDAEYAGACRSAAAKLPGNLRVEIKGPISPMHVPAALASEQFFLFPTLGENFGHVVPEALSAGCPVLISDQTPWNDLGDRGAGWVLPLGDRAAWKEAVQACVDMDADAYAQTAERARSYIVRYIEASGQLGRNLEMFRQALLLSHR